MTVRTLRLMGHDVRDIRGTSDEGMEDEDLWAMAQREERQLITTDKGFTHYRAEPHYGILIIRLRRPNRQKIHARIMQAMGQFSESEWPGLLVTMRDVAQSIWRARDRFCRSHIFRRRQQSACLLPTSKRSRPWPESMVM